MTTKQGRLISFAFILSKPLVLLLLLIAPLLNGCASKPESEKMQLVASIEPLAWFAERIGGDRVAVSVMVPVGGNPHTYEPTPQQMARVSHATLFIKAGSGVEFELDWMQRLVDLNKSMAICNASDGVQLLPMSETEQDAAEAPDGHHRHGTLDPHFWLSPQNARLIAKNVEHSLAALDPDHESEYARNRARVDEELQQLDAHIRKRLAGVQQRRFLVFHPAWGYFAREYGLEQIAIEQEGKTLTPRQMEKVTQVARRNGIRVVFISPEFSAAQADAIAHDIGGKTVTVDPLAHDYLKNLANATEAFVRGMQ